MDHEAGDKYMSGWVATCVHNGTRFFATEDCTYTDRIARAAWRRWGSDADKLAKTASVYGFVMVAERVAEVIA
jgi:hypothetical protein